jgi:hypothetical protein
MAVTRASTPHVVLAGAESDSYRSLRHRSISRAKRFKLGQSLREKVPRHSLADWKPPADRPDRSTRSSSRMKEGWNG